MATARSQEVICSLVPYSTLNLEEKADHCTHYRGLVVSGDTLIVLDFTEKNLWLHRNLDGKLLAKSNKLESDPLSICLISNTEVAVILVDCKIEILSFISTGDTGVITHVRTLDATTRLELCDAVAKVRLMDQLVVSGRDKGMMCWCVVSLKDGHADRIHQICKGWRDSHMAIKNNMIYISCEAGPVGPDSHEVSGVYAYDIQNPQTRKFLYQHSDLQRPWGLTVDSRGFIFVCNGGTSHIHQLTDKGEQVTIHKLPELLTPRDIFYEDQHRVLYITNLKSNKITRYKLDYLNQGVPIEILNMDDRSIQLFEEALKDGEETVYNIRVMVVGHLGVGKTTLIKRLLGEEVTISERRSTEGIDVHVNCCDVSLSTGKWTRRKTDLEQEYQLHRLTRVLNEQQSKKDRVSDEEHVVIPPQGETTDNGTSDTDKEHVKIPPQGERTLKNHEGNVVAEDKDTELLYRRSHQQDFVQDLVSTTSQLEESPLASVEMIVPQSETNTLAMIKLLKENADKLKPDTARNSPLTMWDFAGQYAFYTTHQTFLTRRAIYLLVSDISEQVTNLVADVCYFDSEGIMKCKVHELIEVWLNSIHSCAPSPESSIPPVILVGTHVDKISQKQSPPKGTELETQTMPTTSTPAATATNEQPRALTFIGAVKKFFQPWKTEGIVEVTPVTSMKGAHALLAEDDIIGQRKKVKSDVMAAPSTKKPTEEMIVGVDAEKGSHHEICKKYFREIRSYLNDKPMRFHLVDEDFAIDNTVIDSRLEDLKSKIVEVASQQPYWGEKIPARWLIMEQELMKRKAAKVKVISRKDVENINKEKTVRIEKSEELDLFLRFLHETGTIIYFSIKTLRDNIVLDPEWLIDALKSLINAQPNPLKNPADNGSQSDIPADNGTQSDSSADNDSQSKSPADSDADDDSQSQSATDSDADNGSRSKSPADNDSQSKSPADSDVKQKWSGSQSNSPADNGPQSNSPANNDSQSKSPADSDADNDSQSKSSADSEVDNDSQSTSPADSDADNDSQSKSPADSDVKQKWSGSQSNSPADNGPQSNSPANNDSQSKSPADSDADNDSQSKSSADSEVDNDSQSKSPSDSDADNDSPSKSPADSDVKQKWSGSQSNSPADNGPQSNSPANNDSQSTSPADSDADNDSQSKSSADSDADNDSQSKSPADSDAYNDSQSKSSADSDVTQKWSGSQSNSPADNGTQSNKSPADSDADKIDVTQKWSDFKVKGILALELVDAVWTKEKYPELHAHKDHILLIMEQLNIIAKPRVFSEFGEEKAKNYFLTPCMLRQESPREVISPEQAEQDPRMVSTSVLCWVFTGKFLPPPIFHRLLAACVAHWPVAKKKDTLENLIFCGCCIFDLGLFHRLILHCRNHIVFARITKMVIDEVKIPDAKLCTRVRKFITLNLKNITSYLSQNLQVELRIHCPPSQRISEGDMDEFGPPFQMWFADEGQDSDAAITHEHMNNARLNIALTSVCANAMREILLKHVPEPYTNIYQAILANHNNLTSKRQGSLALLKQDQRQLVFPDPWGRYVATVDHFDISLLYILVRNVSTVPPHLMGWGFDPIDQPFRDRSLGASVERIRLYRNLIGGHSAHGQISQQDFENYWKKIGAVLHDIEYVIGGRVYSQELDKQERHVITIYEAYHKHYVFAADGESKLPRCLCFITQMCCLVLDKQPTETVIKELSTKENSKPVLDGYFVST